MLDGYLSLPLLVTRIAADNPDDAFAPDNLAVLTDAFYGCLDLHHILPIGN
jgi:hypothetical protein